MKLRLLVPLLVSFFISYFPSIINSLFERINVSEFNIKGNLSDYIVKYDKKNEVKFYEIPLKEISKIKNDGVVELGLGVISGIVEVSCVNKNKIVKINEFGNNKYGSYLRDGLTLYNTVPIPLASCEETIKVIVEKDPSNFVSSLGWKSGSLTFGVPSFVRSYKNIFDFFSSYFRILISIIIFILISISNKSFEDSKHSKLNLIYENAVCYLALHFLASSSIIDSIFPNSINLGFLLLMTGGSISLTYMFVAVFFIQSKNVNILNFLSSKSFNVLLFVSFVSFYSLFGSKFYLEVNFILGGAIFLFSILSKTPGLLLTGLLIVLNVSSASGMVLKGHPTNTASHFFLVLFIYDYFEYIRLSGNLNKLLSVKEMNSFSKVVKLFQKRFSINKISVCYFNENYKFITDEYVKGQLRVLPEIDSASALVAFVISVKKSLFRVNRDKFNSLNFNKDVHDFNVVLGEEFSIFPLSYHNKTVGTLNLTNYDPFYLGDITQTVLFLECIDKVLPFVSHSKYEEGMSPIIKEVKRIKEVENQVLENENISLDVLKYNIKEMAKAVNCKVIISKAYNEKKMFRSFLTANYSEKNENFLKNHETLITKNNISSPANTAFQEQVDVFIYNINSVSYNYSSFLANFLRNNNSNSLFVSPCITSSLELPWGVIWVESENVNSLQEEDLLDLLKNVSCSIEKMINFYLKSNQRMNLLEGFNGTLPPQIIKKLEKGLNPREEESGYLLNIDLSGSTKLCDSIGEVKFRSFVDLVNENLINDLICYDFESQVLVWDSFVFTRPSNLPNLSHRELNKINEIINECITKSKNISGYDISYRSIINYGDITRDWSFGKNKYWTIVGDAYAKSCKLEESLKGTKLILYVDESCPEIDRSYSINVNLKKVA